MVTGESLDPALFVALYLGVVATVYALGEPRSRTDTYLRTGTLIMCAIITVVMMAWLVIGILHRFGLLQLLGD
jgi:Na+/H+ antiporter NhaC